MQLKNLLFHAGDQMLFNIIARKHPDWITTLPFTINIQLKLMDFSMNQEKNDIEDARTNQTLYCRNIDQLWILHGNSNFFLHDDTALKNTIWSCLHDFVSYGAYSRKYTDMPPTTPLCNVVDIRQRLRSAFSCF